MNRSPQTVKVRQ